MSEATIRLADLGDDVDMAAITALTAAFKAEDDEVLSWSDGLGLATQLRRRAAFVLLAVRDTEIVGMLMAQRTLSSFWGREACNIHDLYLVESARGEGLGRRLMDACADHARALGCGRLTLEVNADNEAARSLYRSLGFDIPEETGPSGSTFFVKCPLERYGQMKTKTT